MILTLLPFGYNKDFTKIVSLSALFYLLIIFMLYMCNIISLYSLTITNVVVESFVSLTAYICVKKYKILCNEY